ncbi:hypothetical protein [Methylobacterium sp. J-090]|uniref:hypothetical protein n=1 Tax=Methylobacterium sp. J-090 TaxID=2836666 RepID=UPI001FB9CEDA|nr:hypothetical protein [Methylobacterium sp. J-090]MCJ2081749.1 hypothetical protein [Methylobacterium sp. J-090]
MTPTLRTTSVRTLAGLALLVAGAGPALAQSSGNPNTLNNMNDRLATQSQIRGVQTQQQFDNSQNRMQIQRNELFRPEPSAGPTIVAPRR